MLHKWTICKSYQRAAGDDWIRGRKNDRSGAAVEEKAFRSLEFNDKRQNDAVNDIFRAIIISDSPPVKNADMVLCQKIDVDTEGGEHALNILRECIGPGVTIAIPFSVDVKMFAALGGDDPCRYIMDCVRVLSEYQSAFRGAFAGGRTPYPTDAIILGGGAGYVSKTVTYPIYQGDAVYKVSQLMQNQFPPRGKNNHHHDRDERTYHVSPHALKTTRCKGQSYDMGLCEIELEGR